MTAPKKPWTVTQLRTALDEDLKLCNTDLEKSCCRAIGEREIRDLIAKMAAQKGDET